MKIAVIGLGQSLRGDDAAGLEAVRLWQQRFPESAGHVSVELSELPGLGLLDLLDGMEAAVLVDAVQHPDRPGRIFCLHSDDLAAFSPDTQSAHGWGVAETLSLGLSLYPALRECRISLIGIAGSQFDLGAPFSPEVQAGLGETAALIEKEVQGLL